MLINFGHITSGSIYGSLSVCLLTLPFAVRACPAIVFIWVHILENARQYQMWTYIQFFSSGTSWNISYFTYFGVLNLLAIRYSFLLRYAFWGMFIICNCKLVSWQFLRINGTFPILPVIAWNFVASKEPKLLHDCWILNAPSLFTLVSQTCTSGFSISFCTYLSIVDHTTQLFWFCLGMHQNSKPFDDDDDDDDSVHVAQLTHLYYSTLLSCTT
jgi:hypothetical protein